MGSSHLGGRTQNPTTHEWRGQAHNSSEHQGVRASSRQLMALGLHEQRSDPGKEVVAPLGWVGPSLTTQHVELAQ